MEHVIHQCDMGYSKRLSLYVFGDLQAGSDGFQRECWEQFRNEFKADAGAIAIGLGDYDDFTRPSLRPVLEGALGKDSSAKEALDRLVLKANDQTIKMMDFLTGRCVLLHEGHHNWRLSSGIITDQRIASALRAPFGGFIASSRLILNYGGGQRSTVYTIVSTHGNANGRRVHSALAWLEGNIVNAFVADQFLMGHGCKSGNMTPMERQHVRRRGPAGLDRRLPRLMVVGGFSRSYTDGWKSDYVQRAGMSPQPVGWGVIRFRIVHSPYKSEIHGLVPKRKNRTSAYNTSTLDVEQVTRHPLA